MKEKIKNVLTGPWMTSLVCILLGISLTFAPINMVNLICKFVFGILLIAAGLYHVVIYAWEKMNATMLDLFSGAILLVLGVFLFRNPSIVIKLLPVLLGALILMDCIWSLKCCFRIRKLGNASWKFLLLATVIFIGLGTTLIINPFSVVKTVIVFAGCVFLVNGIFDIVFMILIKSAGKKNAEPKEEPQEESAEVAETKTDDYEPWNGATAVPGKTEKTGFWKKLKKSKDSSQEIASEEIVSEEIVSEEIVSEEITSEEIETDTIQSEEKNTFL